MAKKASLSSGGVSLQKFFSRVATVEERVSTDLIVFDIILGGGLDRGDVIEFASESALGKSTICLPIVRYFLEKGEKVL